MSFLDLAVKSAIDGLKKNHGGQFGACVVKGEEVVSIDHNEVFKTNEPTMHAEINAIRKASKKLGTFDLTGCEIYSTCMPCPMCLGAIKWANIKTVYYGATSRDADDIGFRDEIFYGELDISKIKGLEIINIERELCLKPFKLWQNKQNKTMY